MDAPHDKPASAEPPEASPGDAPDGRKAPVRRFLEPSPRFADSFGLVLLLMILSYFIAAIVGEYVLGRAVGLVVLAATTWLALRASQVERRILRVTTALIPVVTAAAIVLAMVGSNQTARLVFWGLTCLLVIVAPVAIIKRLARHPVISANTFYGAVSVYFLIAMFFATLFALIGEISGEPFFVAGQISGDRATTTEYLYFSLTTITTTGYGDLTAAGSIGRLTAVMEAVFGQLYLITVVALVVQNLGQARRRGRTDQDGGEGDDA